MDLPALPAPALWRQHRAQAMRERHAALLPPYPYCPERKGPVWRAPRVLALQQRYIQVQPAALRGWIVVDIDARDGSGLHAWADAGLPCPNLAVATRHEDGSLGGVHLWWGLADPVCTSRRGRIKPKLYAEAIARGMCRAVGGDEGFGGFIAKCPMHPDWHVVSHSERLYTLADLAERCRPVSPARARVPDLAGLGRNSSLFERGRHWAYTMRRTWSGSREAWMATIHQQLAGWNAGFMTPLPEREVEGIARSVGRWVWERYQGDGVLRRRGLLATEVAGLPLAERQAIGGRHSAKQRRMESLGVLRAALAKLQDAEGDAPTQVQVAQAAGRSLRTVKSLWRQLITPEEEGGGQDLEVSDVTHGLSSRETDEEKKWEELG